MRNESCKEHQCVDRSEEDYKSNPTNQGLVQNYLWVRNIMHSAACHLCKVQETLPCDTRASFSIATIATQKSQHADLAWWMARPLTLLNNLHQKVLAFAGRHLPYFFYRIRPSKTQDEGVTLLTQAACRTSPRCRAATKAPVPCNAVCPNERRSLLRRRRASHSAVHVFRAQRVAAFDAVHQRCHALCRSVCGPLVHPARAN